MATYNNINDAQKEVLEKLNKIGRAVAIQVFNSIIMQSPVDTGRFRGNWQVSINNHIGSEIPPNEAKGRVVNAAELLAGMQLKDVVYLTNNLPYAEALEYGWSSQRPSGWVRTTVATGQAALDKKVREIGDN